MKNCTKLHFYNPLELNDTIQEFFLGGQLSIDELSGKVYYQINNKTYFLTDEDYELFTGPTSDDTKREILPIYDVYSLKQNLECRCSIIRGELLYDVRQGVPLKAMVAEKRLCILNIINKTPGVSQTKILSEKIINKKYTLNIEITSDFGTFVIAVS